MSNKVVSHDEWLTARLELLAAEKQVTRTGAASTWSTAHTISSTSFRRAARMGSGSRWSGCAATISVEDATRTVPRSSRPEEPERTPPQVEQPPGTHPAQ